MQINNLIKRWNKKYSQANIYLKSGIGISHIDIESSGSKVSSAIFTGVSADWEDRRYYVSYENRYTNIDDVKDFYMQSSRVGIAPYIGDYGDLHTWIMLQIDHMPASDDNFTISPLIRIFKDVHLFELGMNNNNKFLFNYVFRY